MIFLLDIILLINFIIAFRAFKNIIAPPILMGGGMLCASLLVSSYYYDWKLDLMLPITVFCLGGGTLTFTFICILLNKYSRRKYTLIPKKIDSIYFYNIRLKLFYILTLIIATTAIIAKLYYFRSWFGTTLNISSILHAVRVEQLESEKFYILPSWCRMILTFSQVTSYVTIWLLAKHFLIRKFNNITFLLLIFHFFITFIDAFFSGTKGAIISLFFRSFIIFIMTYYAKNQSFNIDKSIYKKIAFVFLLIPFSFRFMSLAIGRNVEMQSNLDLFAEYCGAEIKNFDIYMHNAYPKNELWGVMTFRKLYEDLGIITNDFCGEFQSIGNYTLGNVYTIFYNFHNDWGIVGCIICPIFMAIFSMIFYKKCIRTLNNTGKLSPYLFLYSIIAFTILMCFFSSKFSEIIVRLSFIRTVIYLYVITLFFNKFIIKKN